jgi:pSer/pThr/pTyr-binding forkhead associated (FHA) protein
VKAAIEELQWVEFAERSVKLQALHGMGMPGSANGGMGAGTNGGEPGGERRIVLGRILVGCNGQTIAERELTPGRFIIGRTPDNDLQIDSKYISRHHAQIITSIHTSVLEDLNSTNGIYVRSKRVRRRMLNDGDVVQIGQHEIMYFDERTNRSRTAFHEIDDDAQLMNDGAGISGDRGHAATLAQDDDSSLEEREDQQAN